MNRPGGWISRSVFASAAAVVVVSVLVAWVGMSGPRLAKTEGHRAIPAWEMLETGELFPTRMFGTIYVNKPPGLPWAIAVSSAVFGENEFAARLPSALGHTLFALLALLFGRAWFGAVGGLGSGVATALLPGFIAPARSADIESLLCLSAAMVAYPLVSLIARSEKWTKREPRLLAMIVVVGMVCGALLKGPVLMLVVMGVWGGGWFIVGRDRRKEISRWAAWAPLAGLFIGAGILFAMYASLPDNETVVRQSMGGFLWSADQLKGIALLGPGALALALPMSIALVFPFGKDARAEAGATMDERGVRIARVLAASTLAGLGVGMVYGLANPRYALPVLVLIGPLVGYVVAGSRGGFSEKRSRIARAMLLGNGVAWVAVLIGATMWWVIAVRPEGRDRGYDAAVRIVEKLEHSGTVWAGQAVFSKPEVIWYMRELAAERGIELQCSWEKEAVKKLRVPPAGTVAIFKRAEWELYEENGMASYFVHIVDVTPDTRGFVVVRSLGLSDVE
jgi:4-amino-4-deoxy-L-arabinose transferase-like glycosyltransferase